MRKGKTKMIGTATVLGCLLKNGEGNEYSKGIKHRDLENFGSILKEKLAERKIDICYEYSFSERIKERFLSEAGIELFLLDSGSYLLSPKLINDRFYRDSVIVSSETTLRGQLMEMGMSGKEATEVMNGTLEEYLEYKKKGFRNRKKILD